MKKVALISLMLLTASPALAEEGVVVHTLDSAYATKFTDKTAQAIYAGEIGYLDPAANPWRSVSQGKWDREIDPVLKKDNYSLSANADYDEDGTPDTAKVYTNGKQTAVIVTSGVAGKAPMVIYKADGIVAGLEVMGQGKRFLVNIPEIGYRVLGMYKGRPAVVVIGE